MILYCLLNRNPIIILGGDTDKIDDLLIRLSELIHFRKEYIFYTDFVSRKKYENLIENKNIDYNYQRGHIGCLYNAFTNFLSQFNSFYS